MKHKYLKDVVTLSMSTEKCISCKKCIEVCPHAVFKMKDSKVYISDKNACMECGACTRNCPVKAIKVNASVGCVSAIIRGSFTRSETICGCSGESGCC